MAPLRVAGLIEFHVLDTEPLILLTYCIPPSSACEVEDSLQKTAPGEHAERERQTRDVRQRQGLSRRLLGAEVAVDVEVADVEAGEHRRTCDESPGEESFLAGRFGEKKRSEKEKTTRQRRLLLVIISFILHPRDDVTFDADL